MRQTKDMLYYVFGEPLLWLFSWCFQPGQFAREFERHTAFTRILPSLRLIPILFLIDCPLALVLRMSVRFIVAIPSPHLFTLLMSIIVTSLAGVVLGLLGGLGLGLSASITIGLAGGISFGLMIGSVDDSLEAHILGGIAAALIVLSMLQVAGSSAGNAVLSGILAGVIAGVTVGVVAHFTLGGDVADMILGCMVGMMAGITVSRRRPRPIGGVHPRSRSLIIGVILTGVLTILNRWIGGVVFALTFLLIFYRLPLYIISSLSTWRALRAARKNPAQVFSYLHSSALYRDEYVYLPLPGLRMLLKIAAEQHIERTLEEVMFIVMERPLQIKIARAVALDIALHDLHMRTTLRDIAGASVRLREIFPHGTGLIDPQWSMIFLHLHDASENALQACSPLGWQVRHNALEAMLINLKQLHPETAFNDMEMNTCLAEIIALWQETATHELRLLEEAPEKTRRISNPYNPGPALERQNTLFVGRYDLASQLGEALSCRDHRPTFLLYGERRMGKSSILKHLPDLLGASFLPVFYDLQSPDSTSSITALLSLIAEEIVFVMETRGLKAKKLPYERLQEARKENEGAVYYVFNRWLKGIEKTLEREDRTLLLTFDEFEKLNIAGREGHLHLELLLNWFRSIMQHHHRLILLFSGLQPFSEMGASWAGYFVNVQTLKVSFLQPEEAYQLITQPIQGVPAEQIFGPGVIEEIIRVTHCHPFLVQALSSALIDSLNSRRRDQIEVQDVTKAIKIVFKNWGSTYFRDLWERTDTRQRTCLSLLKKLGNADLLSLEQQSGLHRQLLHHVMETLEERDLVQRNEAGFYQITAPLFCEWVARNEVLQVDTTSQPEELQT